MFLGNWLIGGAVGLTGICLVTVGVVVGRRFVDSTSEGTRVAEEDNIRSLRTRERPDDSNAIPPMTTSRFCDVGGITVSGALGCCVTGAVG